MQRELPQAFAFSSTSFCVFYEAIHLLQILHNYTLYTWSFSGAVGTHLLISNDTNFSVW